MLHVVMEKDSIRHFILQCGRIVEQETACSIKYNERNGQRKEDGYQVHMKKRITKECMCRCVDGCINVLHGNRRVVHSVAVQQRHRPPLVGEIPRPHLLVSVLHEVETELASECDAAHLVVITDASAVRGHQSERRRRRRRRRR